MELGPIGLTIGRSAPDNPAVDARGPSLLSGGGVELGPIGLTIGKSAPDNPAADASGQAAPIPSIHSMTTSEWRAAYEQDGMVDLWVEEEFNAGSRLVVRTHWGGDPALRLTLWPEAAWTAGQGHLLLVRRRTRTRALSCSCSACTLCSLSPERVPPCASRVPASVHGH